MAQLVSMLAERRLSRQQPILFLGEGVARAANVPGIKDMARDLYLRITSEPSDEQVDPDDVVNAFYGVWDTLEPFERQSLLQSYFAQLPVPEFYFDLAQLLIDECFVMVLTTSIDLLLEQALSFSGLKQGEDYLVATFALREEPTLAAIQRSGKTPIRILKLHGDLSGSRVAITPDEIERHLGPQRAAVKGNFLSGEIVLAGYSFESQPINEWLAWTQGVLWWVSPDHPDQEHVGPLEAAHTINYVDGSNADPKELFGILRMGLLSPVQITRTAPVSKYAKSIESYPTEAAFALESTSPGDTDIEAKFLAQRLEQHIKRKRELEAVALYVSSVDQDTETQLRYESNQITKLEQRLDQMNG